MKKELAVLVFGAMLAAALCADAGTLLEIPKDVKLGDRQCKALSFPGVDPAKGRVVVDLSCRIDYPRATEKIVRVTVKNPVKTVFSVDRKTDEFNVSVSGGGGRLSPCLE